MAAIWEAIYPYVSVLLPTITLILIFWWVMRSIVNADRREREAAAEGKKLTEAQFEDAVEQRMKEIESEMAGKNKN
ncbi:hypothetical protein [Pseudoglutamicibacter cumminsii]|uniref:Envelope stress response membrane protein PspB n=1 Tax=Pseudoglutamicibacter cumminsii TaxID=156979 RepID=A0ABX5L3E2_9MICC|nr:hypothetical protein [Pseudoglutamicibacter cumminsii]PWI27083.1 hypothetical protein CAY35_09170 [Pseudoglutamicibacter cumminsii]